MDGRLNRARRTFRVRRYEEREDKFDVEAEWVMPQLAALVPTGGKVVQDIRSLDSTYFDTPGAALRVFGITLRRRIGGSDTGWQLKVPNGTSRTELQSGARSKTVPRALSHAVSGLLAGESVAAVATLVTTRTAYRVFEADDQLVMEVADDQVESGPADGELPVRSWREVEVELGPAGKKKTLKKAWKLLRAAGAEPSESRNKLDQALGGIPLQPDEGGFGAGPGTVGELVGDYVAEQCDVLASNDVGLRTGVNVVHKTRVAARRLRSTLRVFDDLFDAAAAEKLNEELVWYADLLGQVRDRDVLSHRLAERIAALPSDQLRGPVDVEVAKTLEQEREEAYQRLREGMDTDRYQHLIRLLRGWRSAPPFTDAAGADRAELDQYVSRAKRKADKRLRKAGDDVERLHRARKAMKRLRYAAELGEPADSALSDIASEAKHLQTVLGDHQDAIVAAEFLATAARSNGAAASAFTYGVLMANELAAAARIRAELVS
jgi:CHAD domain-containing protein